eukprot:TRINITY_DN1318_c0_g2_i2.p2 TRINITY_DN1318_c0_g2~~TRINITY_DN1318_c0_g2_i2.p2  ORF type:complete len:201 (+),score=38.46 TRINITY_DN1318_c0_g2_i2:697-1299(+)
MTQITYWNVRGLISPSKQHSVLEVIRKFYPKSESPNYWVLSETHHIEKYTKKDPLFPYIIFQSNTSSNDRGAGIVVIRDPSHCNDRFFSHQEMEAALENFTCQQGKGGQKKNHTYIITRLKRKVEKLKRKHMGDLVHKPYKIARKEQKDQRTQQMEGTNRDMDTDKDLCEVISSEGEETQNFDLESISTNKRRRKSDSPT